MKLFSKIAALSVGLAMAVGVGVAVGSGKASEARADGVVASFSRSGTTNSVTGGTFTSAASAQNGYYQDGSGTDRYIQVLNNTAYWTTTPSSISLTCVLGGGSGNKDLANPVKAWLLDSTGSVISSTETSITSKITTNTGDTYSDVAIPLTNNVYGIRVGHTKESGYNVRYYSFSLSYAGDGPVVETHDITFNSNGEGVTNMPSTLTGQTGTVSLASVAKPEREGYKFVGWSLSSAGETVSSVTITDSNVELFAIWAVKEDVHYVETSLKEGKLLITTTFNEETTYYLPTARSSSACPSVGPFTNVDDIDSDNLWNISKSGDNWVIKNDSDEYLYATNANNGLRIGDTSSEWIENSDGSLKETTNNRYLGVYNNQDWRSYTTIHDNYKGSATALKYYEVESIDPELDTLVVKMNGSETSPQSVGYGIGSVLLDAYDGESTVISEWASSNTSVATVALNSLNRAVVTFVAPGEVTITASKSGYNDGVFKLTITKGDLQSVAISGSLTKTTYATTEAWSHDGLTATATYSTGWQEDVSSSATWTYNPSAPVEDLEQVTITATLSGKSDSKSYNISVTPVPSTPISWFYENKSSIDSTETYSIKGTCIGIQGNSYYLQDGEYGMLVYGGSKVPPTGLAVGKKVLINCKVTFYGTNEEKLFENQSGTITSAEVIGDGNLPSATVVDTWEDYVSSRQSTYVTFNGLNTFAWSQEPVFSGTSKKDGVGTAKDKNGTSVSVFVSRYLDATEGAAIVSALAAIGEEDTFDVVRSIKAISTGSTTQGQSQVSILSSEQIVRHTPEEDAVLSWIGTYMYMDDSRFDGDGTGLCYSDNIYVTAKTALIALGETNVVKFEANAEGKYDAAKARYLEWARICKDSAPFEDDFSFTSLSINISSYQSNIDSSSSITIIVIVAITSMTLLGVTLVIRKRKHQ